MNFAVVVGASLRSGYALPACHPDNGTPRRQPAEVPLIKRGNLSRQSRPALAGWSQTASSIPMHFIIVRTPSHFNQIAQHPAARERVSRCSSSITASPPRSAGVTGWSVMRPLQLQLQENSAPGRQAHALINRRFALSRASAPKRTGQKKWFSRVQLPDHGMQRLQIHRGRRLRHRRRLHQPPRPPSRGWAVQLGDLVGVHIELR